MNSTTPRTRCEKLLIRNLEDAHGYPCGKDSSEACSDCGTAICDLHAESCDLCGEILCAGCFVGHMREPHAKPMVQISARDSKRRTA